MTSQNRLNAGAEYVLYRIWATLQTDAGIHVESLLTCVGGLAGYACRDYARRMQTHRRASASDSSGTSGTSHRSVTDDKDRNDTLDPNTLNQALIHSPLSIWALVSRAVLKLEQPLPDIHEIVQHALQAADADTRQIPQLPNWHRPHQPAIVYLRQLWPQTLPIAQRFCLRPMQMPVLYGIALQRAIEHTKGSLSPTLAASISMECAIAMSRVELLETVASEGVAPIRVTARQPAVAPNAVAPNPVSPNVVSPNAIAAANPAVAATTNMTTSSRALALPSILAPRSTSRNSTDRYEFSLSRMLAVVKGVPPTAHIATLACLAFVTTAGAMYRTDARERPQATQTVQLTEAAQPDAPAGPLPNTPVEAAQDEQPFRSDLTEQRPTNSNTSASPTPNAPPLAPIDDEGPPIPQPSDYGSDNEGLMRDDAGQPIQMATGE